MPEQFYSFPPLSLSHTLLPLLILCSLFSLHIVLLLFFAIWRTCKSKTRDDNVDVDDGWKRRRIKERK